MRLAIVHDFLNQMGGAEQVVKIFREIFPKAPIYTSIYNPSAVCESFQSATIHTSFMQRLPMIKKHARRYFILYPYAFEMFDLSEYDVVLSSSSSFAKGVITRPDTCHVCYCYTPMRFAWNYHVYIEQEPMSRLTKCCLPYFIHRLRRWDEITANRVDRYVAISGEVRKRIRKYYRRDAAIIYPPVDTSKYAVSEEDEGYYLALSRLLPYKRIDIAIEAFNRLRLPLKIVGEGRDLGRLKKMAGPTVEFLGRLSDEERNRCLRECKALIFPGLEDFGLTPLEAMASGKPVLAYAAGGALETVRAGVSGTFFYEQRPEAVADAVKSFDPGAFEPQQIRKHAELFDVDVFKEQIRRFVEDSYEEHRSPSVIASEERFGILAHVDQKIYAPEQARHSSMTDR